MAKKKRTRSNAAPADPEVVHARNASGQAICGAPKKSGGACGQTDVDPLNGRCSWHSGSAGRAVTTGKNVMRPWLRTQRWARDKGTIASIVANLEKESALPNLEDPVRLLQALTERYAELTEQNDGRDYREGALDILKAFMAGGDNAPSLDQLYAFLEKGANELAALDRVQFSAKTLHATIAENEKLRLARQNALSFPEALALVTSVLEIVARLAPDQAPAIVLEVKGKVFRQSPQLASGE